MDIYDLDRARILGPSLPGEVIERVQANLAHQAAQELEREHAAYAQQKAQARAAEDVLVAQAESIAVEQLRALQPLYAQRQEAARQARESLAALWAIEQEIRNGLQLADRPLQNVEALLEPALRGQWRAGLRERAGLPQHLYMPDVKPANAAQAIGVTVVRGITAGVIQPGALAVGDEVVSI